jgi:pimeloyl-ACP methyl ester carboxylesterase
MYPNNQLSKILQKVVGPILPKERGVPQVPLDVAWVAESETQNGLVQDFTFSPDEGELVHGTLVRPPYINEQIRDVAAIYFHQTTEPLEIGRLESIGKNGNPDFAYGAEITRYGIPAVGIDHPGFGNYKTETYDLGFGSVTAQMIWNHLCLLAALPELGINNVRRILLVGHSLGGTNAMFFSCFSPDVSAMICSGSATTFNDFSNFHGGALSRWSRSDKYMPAIKECFADDPDQMPFDIPDILAAFSPYPLVLASNEEDEIFPAQGARACASIVQTAYRKNKAEKFFDFLMYPGAHGFSLKARNQSYDFIINCLTSPS